MSGRTMYPSNSELVTKRYYASGGEWIDRRKLKSVATVSQMVLSAGRRQAPRGSSPAFVRPLAARLKPGPTQDLFAKPVLDDPLKPRTTTRPCKRRRGHFFAQVRKANPLARFVALDEDVCDSPCHLWLHLCLNRRPCGRCPLRRPSCAC